MIMALTVGRGPAEPKTPVEPAASMDRNKILFTSCSVEAGSSVIYGRVVHSDIIICSMRMKKHIMSWNTSYQDRYTGDVHELYHQAF